MQREVMVTPTRETGSTSFATSPRKDWLLSGKTFVVTGASKGIGKAVVSELVLHGANCIIWCSRNTPGTDYMDDIECDPDIVSPDCSLCHVACDLSTPNGRQMLYDACVQTLQITAIHGLVNNVGVNVRKSMTEQTEEEYHTMMRTNVDSAYFVSQKLLPLLEAGAAATEHFGGQGGASVVNISSAAGVQSTGTGVAYAMTKAALNQMTRSLACEWASKNIRVNAVAPWMTLTPMLQAAVDGDATQLDKPKAWTPLKRLATAKEIAAPVVFLLMPASGYITGQTLCVDGGLTAQGFQGPCVQE